MKSLTPNAATKGPYKSWVRCPPHVILLCNTHFPRRVASDRTYDILAIVVIVLVPASSASKWIDEARLACFQASSAKSVNGRIQLTFHSAKYCDRELPDINGTKGLMSAAAYGVCTPLTHHSSYDGQRVHHAPSPQERPVHWTT